MFNLAVSKFIKFCACIKLLPWKCFTSLKKFLAIWRMPLLTALKSRAMRAFFLLLAGWSIVFQQVNWYLEATQNSILTTVISFVRKRHLYCFCLLCFIFLSFMLYLNFFSFLSFATFIHTFSLFTLPYLILLYRTVRTLPYRTVPH